MALIIIGIALILWAFIHTKPYREAKKWKHTDGSIINTIINEHKEPSLYVVLEYLHPQVEYEYEVEGVKYTCTRVSFEKRNELIPSESEDKYWEKWLPGKNTTVYFNPLIPSEAVLIRSLRPKRMSHYHALYTAGVLLIIIGGWFLLYGA